MRFGSGCPLVLVLVLSVLLILPSIATAAGTGRLLVRITGVLAGPVPPSLEITGPRLHESSLIGAVAIAAGELRGEDLDPGIYRVVLAGGAGPEPQAVEIGVYPGRTSVVILDLAKGTLQIDPDRPDPFGIDDAWDPTTGTALGGSGEEDAISASTSPFAPRGARLDGIDLEGRGFRREVVIRGDGIARASATPIGPVSAADETAQRHVLSDSRDRVVEVGGATGSQGGGYGKATAAYRFSSAPWQPRVFASIRPLHFTDAAPSAFGGGSLPHNDLSALDLYARAQLRPGSASHLDLSLYGSGSRRNYYLEAYKLDSGHSPRQDRADFAGAVRADHGFGARTKLLGEANWERTFVATGDGKYYDNLASYLRGINNPGLIDASRTYWAPGHAYSYYRKSVQVDLTGTLEMWRDPGTRRAAGVGLVARRGTYRSFEQLNPAGATVHFQAIGYDSTGAKHTDSAGRAPGKPLTMAGFATVRRPFAGGDIEVGVRGTLYKSSQRPLASFTRPDTGATEILVYGAQKKWTTVDPRVGYTRAIGPRARFWLTGGAETRVPPAEAVYFSPEFAKLAAYRTEGTVLGNPALKPERDWMAVAAAGLRPSETVTLRAGLAGRRTYDAITPRAFRSESGSGGGPPDTLFAYVNDGRRDLIDLFARLTWEASAEVRVRGSYDLSRARTETIEPAVLDEAWLDPNLPVRGAGGHEGLPPVFPAFDPGTGSGFFPSLFDRRHALAAFVTVHPAGGNAGDEAEGGLFKDLEITASLRATSGRPFTWAEIYPAATLPSIEPRQLAGAGTNSGRMPWFAQLDLRVARLFPFLGADVQGWAEVLNVTNQDNALHVFQGTGLPDQDGSSQSVNDLRYQARLRDPIRYGDPITFRVGTRIAFQ